MMRVVRVGGVLALVLGLVVGASNAVEIVESFNGRVRDELLNLEDFATLTEAQVIVEAWRVEYNTQRPHRSGTPTTAPAG